MQAAPMSRIDDGCNDIAFMTSNKSRTQLARALIAIDDGSYYNKNGEINKSLGLEYIKASEWTLKPTRKGPVPAGKNFQLPEGTQTFPNELFSIDGEKYPAQNIKAKVIPRILRVFC